MNSFKALIVMSIWTALAAYGMYSVGAHEHFRDPMWAAGTAVALLIVLMVNVVIYFKVAGEKPFQWLS